MIYIFIVNGELTTVCEDFASAQIEEEYLITRSNDVEVISIISPTSNSQHCWEALNTMNFTVTYY